MKIDTFEWIKSTFLKLTTKTYPFGFEDGLVDDMIQCGLFPKDLKEDQFGNFYYQVGNSKTIFTSHLDTACQAQVDVSHVFDDDCGNEIVKTDGTSILGADDKAGVTILLWMMKHNIPGTYYFFYGEEVGCLGSTAASNLIDEFSPYHRMVSFDRRGTNSVITHQSSTRTCSDKFAESLASEFNKLNLSYRKDDTGIYTDSAEFVRVISECTNISVGYYNEHTTNERQDLTHLANLADAVILIDWESLPTERDKTKTEYKSYSYSNYPTYTQKRTYVDNDAYDMDHMSTNGIVEYTHSSKKSRRRRKNRWKRKNRDSKVYIESGANLTEVKNWRESDDFMDQQESGQYDMLKVKFLDHNLTRDELSILATQYLDMNDPQDVGYYGYLISTYCGMDNKQPVH